LRKTVIWLGIRTAIFFLGVTEINNSNMRNEEMQAQLNINNMVEDVQQGPKT